MDQTLSFFNWFIAFVCLMLQARQVYRFQTDYEMEFYPVMNFFVRQVASIASFLLEHLQMQWGYVQ